MNRSLIAAVLLAVGLSFGSLRAATEGTLALTKEGAAALSQREYSKAIEKFTESLAKDSTSPDPFFYRAQARTALKQYAGAIEDLTAAMKLTTPGSGIYQRRGALYFQNGQITESIKDFDTAIALMPSSAPNAWPRGISLYYAGEYRKGREQFELHQTYNSEDVENAAWHFICHAREKSFAEAEKSFIPIRDDSRPPMMEVHKLFAGKSTVGDVIKAAEAIAEPQRKRALFYAHLYIGLYLEAKNDPTLSLDHIRQAAEKYSDDDYMSDVARVHLARRLKEKPAATPKPKP